MYLFLKMFKLHQRLNNVQNNYVFLTEYKLNEAEVCTIVWIYAGSLPSCRIMYFAASYTENTSSLNSLLMHLK